MTRSITSRCEKTRRFPLHARLIILPSFVFGMLCVIAAGYAAPTSRDAGYAFAKRLNIVDAKRCAGSTAAFVERCRAYAGHAATRQSFMPTGAYYNGNIEQDTPYWYRDPIYSPVRQFE